MLQYQRPDTELTLAEGLREYYASREGLVSGRGISEEARKFFRCHDAAHVVFGCSTALLDEAAVKVWSFPGTTGGLDVWGGYRLPESKEIYERIRWRETAATAARATATLLRLLWRCLRMRKRRPWADLRPASRDPATRDPVRVRHPTGPALNVRGSGRRRPIPAGRRVRPAPSSAA